MRSAVRPLLSFLLVASLAACGDDENEPGSPDTGAPDAGGDAGTDTGVDTDDASDTGGVDEDTTPDVAPDATPDGEDDADVTPPGVPFPDGEFVIGVSLAPVGGIELRFKIEANDGELVLFATNGTDVSDEMARAEDVQVIDGVFEADFGRSTVPPAFSPTGSAVVVEFQMSGSFREDGTACGDLDGTIVTLRLPLAGSTFGLAAWDDRVGGTLFGCDARETIPRLEDCPTLSAVVTTDFPSGTVPRTVEIVTPSDWDEEGSYPLLFAFHGFGGDPASLLDATSLRDFADSEGIVIIAPLGLDTGNGPLWNVTAAADVNEDIALFDDLLFCATEQLAVNPNRVYATGMSYGGLMTGALLSTRSEILTAAAPFSGGLLQPLDASAPPIPVIAIWGGESDFAFEQDFDTFSTNMIADLVGNGSKVVACDHGEGHVIRGAWWPWTLEFLLAHERGEASSFDTLTESFPDFCTFVD